jgi:DNA-binding MarR family transcriptional regulator
MRTEPRSPEGEAATEVVLSIFRTNGLLLAAGDELSGREQLTSARWQVMGAVELSDRSLTVPQIARRMGLTRQSVHATVANLVREGLAELVPNEDHARSPFVSLTQLGRSRYQAVDRLQASWIEELVSGISRRDLQTTARVLETLGGRLESGTRTSRKGGGTP